MILKLKDYNMKIVCCLALISLVASKTLEEWKTRSIY